MSRPKLKVDTGTVRKTGEELSKIRQDKLATQLQGIMQRPGILPTRLPKILHVSFRSIFG
ncbi:MAG: hypothetical protein A4E63_00280 [Syntrophorhabdus sp. PtaU1.Bin050]|nr:MAG: hypothetical protein A4E63_00280 [Syntrophorhabdus sp. PtaU1.Bin050]